MRQAKSPLSALADQLIQLSRGRSCSAFFVTGTDTAVGKTRVACLLLEEFHRRGILSAGFKPICCGDRDDARRLQQAGSTPVPLDLVNPIHLSKPVAPVSQPCPPWRTLLRCTQSALASHRRAGIRLILVEGAGGLLCPVTRRYTMRDLASALNLPVIIAARDRLGVLNHSLLTIEAARAAGLKCVALVLNRFQARADASSSSNGKVLERLVSVPVYRL